MKKFGVKNIIIVFLCLTIIFLCVGFALISKELEKVKDERHFYDVVFDSIEKVSSVKGGTYEPVSEASIVKEGKEINFSYKLYVTNDEITYNAVIKNNGTFKVKILDLLESPNLGTGLNKLITPVTITYTDLIDKELEPGEKQDLKIVVTYNPSTMISGLREFNYTLGLITK